LAEQTFGGCCRKTAAGKPSSSRLGDACMGDPLDEDMEAAEALGRRLLKEAPVALTASFDQARRRIVVELISPGALLPCSRFVGVASSPLVGED
jgi:hypothetical protein